MSFGFCSFAPMKWIKYLLGFIALLASGCSSKGRYTREVKSRLELMERHLSEGRQADAKEIQRHVAKILDSGFENFRDIMSDAEKMLSDVNRRCFEYRQMKGEVSNLGYAFDTDILRYSAFGVASLDEIIDMKWGEHAEEEWKMTKKHLLWSASMIDKMIERAGEFRERAKEVKKECSKKVPCPCPC